MTEQRYDYLALLRDPDPLGVPRALVDHWEARGSLALTAGERTLYLVQGYLRAVDHGGHEYWYSSEYADDALETADALERLGLADLGAVCRVSFEVWPDERPPVDQEERQTIIQDVWFGEDPDGVMSRIDALDGERYHSDDDGKEIEAYYRFLHANPEAFGLEAATLPPLDEVLATLSRKSDALHEEAARQRAAAPASTSVPLDDEGPRTFRRHWHYYVPTLVMALGLLGMALHLHGDEQVMGARLMGGAGLFALFVAWRKWRYRLILGPDGIDRTGLPLLPWPSVNGVKVLELGLAGGKGYEIRAELPGGRTYKVQISMAYVDYEEAFSMVLGLAARHGAAWSGAEAFRMPTADEG